MRDLEYAVYELYAAIKAVITIIKALFAIAYSFCAEQEDIS